MFIDCNYYLFNLKQLIHGFCIILRQSQCHFQCWALLADVGPADSIGAGHDSSADIGLLKIHIFAEFPPIIYYRHRNHLTFISLVADHFSILQNEVSYKNTCYPTTFPKMCNESFSPTGFGGYFLFKERRKSPFLSSCSFLQNASPFRSKIPISPFCREDCW